jgi:hypothetical protein
VETNQTLSRVRTTDHFVSNALYLLGLETHDHGKARVLNVGIGTRLPTANLGGNVRGWKRMKAIRSPSITYFAKQPLMPQDAKNYTCDRITVQLACVEIDGVREYFVTEFDVTGAPIQ